MAFKVEKTIPQTTRDNSGKGLAELLQTEIVLGKRFSNKKKEAFYSELSVLLKAGIHLREGLELLLDNQTKEKQRQFYKELVDALVAGKSFAETIKTQPDISEYEYYSLKIGEETGTLAKITAELAEYYAVKNEQRRTLMNALSYPIIILCTAILVVTFMLRMVVPMFEDIFRQNGVDLPPITKMIISASKVLQEYGGLFLLVLLL
jgi:type IV pilus assembly protein PilC